MAGSPAEQQLMHLNDDANDVNVAGLNHEVNVETTKCMRYCARCFTLIFETGPIKTKVLMIYAPISIIVILVLLSVLAHKKLDNNSPYSMPDNMDNEFLKLPCKVIDTAQYPPVQKERNDTCFYTRENITKILNATRKSIFKVRNVNNETLAGLEMTNHCIIYYNTREQNFSICLPINDYRHVMSKSCSTYKLPPTDL